MDNGTGIYLYCFARPGAVRGLEAPGVDGKPGVFELESREVAAVSSEVSLNEFRGDQPENEPLDRDWIIPRAYRHERIISRVMSRSPVLPVRFGAVFSSRQNLATLVAERYSEIHEYLEHIAGKAEWAVKGFVDIEKAEAWLLASDADCISQRQQLSESSGRRYFQERQLRAGVQSQVKLWCRTVAEQIQEDLKVDAAEARPLRLQPPAVSGRAGEMVLNLALLLPDKSVANFRARVEALAARYADRGLALEWSGLWPPFNFCPSLANGNA